MLYNFVYSRYFVNLHCNQLWLLKHITKENKMNKRPFDEYHESELDEQLKYLWYDGTDKNGDWDNLEDAELDAISAVEQMSNEENNDYSITIYCYDKSKFPDGEVEEDDCVVVEIINIELVALMTKDCINLIDQFLYSNKIDKSTKDISKFIPIIIAQDERIGKDIKEFYSLFLKKVWKENYL